MWVCLGRKKTKRNAWLSLLLFLAAVLSFCKSLHAHFFLCVFVRCVCDACRLFARGGMRARDSKKKILTGLTWVVGGTYIHKDEHCTIGKSQIFVNFSVIFFYFNVCPIPLIPSFAVLCSILNRIFMFVYISTCCTITDRFFYTYVQMCVY